MHVQTNLLPRLLLSLLLFSVISQCQQAQPSKVHIESSIHFIYLGKYSAFSGEEAMMKVTPEQLVFTVPYNQTFVNKPAQSIIWIEMYTAQMVWSKAGQRCNDQAGG